MKKPIYLKIALVLFGVIIFASLTKQASAGLIDNFENHKTSNKQEFKRIEVAPEILNQFIQEFDSSTSEAQRKLLLQDFVHSTAGLNVRLDSKAPLKIGSMPHPGPYAGPASGTVCMAILVAVTSGMILSSPREFRSNINLLTNLYVSAGAVCLSLMFLPTP